MSVNALAVIAPPDGLDVAPMMPHQPQSKAANAAGFSSMVTQGLEQVNQQLMSTQTDLQTLAIGDAENLHQVMIRLEQARMSFQLMMQVRNRLLEAYQDVMKMQV